MEHDNNESVDGILETQITSCSCYDTGERPKIFPEDVRFIINFCFLYEYVCITPGQSRADLLILNNTSLAVVAAAVVE
jgi:hypothetical protein